MDRVWDKVVKVLAAVGGAIAGWFGEWNALLTALVVRPRKSGHAKSVV